MSVSILRDGKIWGLIVCHHYVANNFVPYEMRTVCEFMGQMISCQLSSKIESENNVRRLISKGHEADLIASMTTEQDFAQGLVASEKAMLALTQAGGAVKFIFSGKRLTWSKSKGFWIGYKSKMTMVMFFKQNLSSNNIQ